MKYQIISAAKLSKGNLDAALALAKAELNASGNPEFVIDSSLLAGIKIVYGSTQLDLSLSGKIDRISNSL